MKTLNLLFVATVLGTGLASAKTDDPVIMTVGGKPVYKSEFEYLYHKNSGQQVEQKSIAEYADMFKNYKLKVADAEAAGLDTVQSVKQELSQYRADLARPYLRDPKVDRELMDEAYDHYKRQLKVAHIMVPTASDGPVDNTKVFLDSIRTEIVNGNLLWNDAVAEYTIDRSTRENGGVMGWILTDGSYPWPFEEMAYSTKIGEISPVVNSGYGYHIIKVLDERPNPGEVHARHILKLTNRVSDEQQLARIKNSIDSISNILKTVPGADFAERAKAESDDGSAKNGGDLGWFGGGRMVPEFEEAAFALKDGEISEPVKTAFGWHIIQRLESRPVRPLDEVKEQLQAYIDGSERSLKSERSKLDQLIVKYNSHLLEDNLDEIQRMIAAHDGGYNADMIQILSQSNIPVAEVNGTTIPVSDIISQVAVTASTDPVNARALIGSTATRKMEAETLEQERINLADDNVDYRNLVNEYRDGILLFEISQDKVWQRAANDRKGLETFFKKNKKKYTFDEPRFKGYVVFAPNDTVEAAIKDYLSTLKNFDPQTLGKEVRDKFGKGVKVERVIAKKGENSITDYLGFGGPMPEKSKIAYSNFFAFRGKVVDQPEEVDDVRGLVIADYQNALEEKWIKELEKKYPVKINEKVLKTVK